MRNCSLPSTTHSPPMPPSPPPTPPPPRQVPWGRREARAVARGTATGFQLERGNWGASPRILLHRLSDANPTLLDARIDGWSHTDAEAKEEMSREGVQLAEPMTLARMNAFKYQVGLWAGLATLLAVMLAPEPAYWSSQARASLR